MIYAIQGKSEMFACKIVNSLLLLERQEFIGFAKEKLELMAILFNLL